MTVKRAGALLIALMLSITMAGCSNGGSDAGASPAATGREHVGRTPGPKDEPLAFPDEPKIKIDWQNTVVDVVPTSRFQERPGGPDTAKFETTLALEDEPDGDTQDFFKELQDVDVEFDGRLVRMTYERDVDEVDENRYKFEFDAPVEFAELGKHDDLSVVVLLPRDAEQYEEAPRYSVQLDQGFVEEFSNDFDIKQAEESPGNRITIGVYEQTDPLIPPVYQYLPRP
jgi:hypothetical protein